MRRTTFEYLYARCICVCPFREPTLMGTPMSGLNRVISQVPVECSNTALPNVPLDSAASPISIQYSQV